MEHAVLKLIDVSGPIELDGGIEPFANHRTALERIELCFEPADHLLEGESVQWRDGRLRLTTPGVCGEFALDRLGDRGLRLVPVRAWTTQQEQGGATHLLLRWMHDASEAIDVRTP